MSIPTFDFNVTGWLFSPFIKQLNHSQKGILVDLLVMIWMNDQCLVKDSQEELKTLLSCGDYDLTIARSVLEKHTVDGITYLTSSRFREQKALESWKTKNIQQQPLGLLKSETKLLISPVAPEGNEIEKNVVPKKIKDVNKFPAQQNVSYPHVLADVDDTCIIHTPSASGPARADLSYPSIESKSIASKSKRRKRVETEKEEKEIKNDLGRPSSIQEVKLYMLSWSEQQGFILGDKMSQDEAEMFWDHFTSNGWRIGGRTAMKDWRSAVRNWLRRNKEKIKSKNHERREQFTSTQLAYGSNGVDFTKLE